MSANREPIKRPPRRRDAAATRRALLTAAQQLVSERGVQGTSTRDVAAAAGVNQALVYRYFGSREKLFAEAATGLAGDDSRSVHATAPLSTLPGMVLDHVIDRRDANGRELDSIAQLLAGVHDDAIRVIVRTRLEQLYDDRLGPRIPHPDGPLRAELLAALVVGIGLLRDKIGTRALATADRADLHRYVDALAATLLGD